MENFKQVRDIVALSRQFHQGLSHPYGRLASSADRQHAKLLLDYLSRHEANLQSCRERYETDTSNRLLGAWCQFVPDTFPFDRLDSCLANPDVSVEQVATLVLPLDLEIAEF